MGPPMRTRPSSRRSAPVAIAAIRWAKSALEFPELPERLRRHEIPRSAPGSWSSARYAVWQVPGPEGYVQIQDRSRRLQSPRIHLPSLPQSRLSGLALKMGAAVLLIPLRLSRSLVIDALTSPLQVYWLTVVNPVRYWEALKGERPRATGRPADDAPG